MGSSEYCQLFVVLSLGYIINCIMQAVHRQIPILVRTMGSSSDLLEIISDPPNGSENLLMQVYCLTLYNFLMSVENFEYIEY